MKCVGAKYDEDFISGNFDDASRSVSGREPTNQKTCRRRTVADFDVLTRRKLEGIKAQLNWLVGRNVEDGRTSVTSGGRTM